MRIHHHVEVVVRDWLLLALVVALEMGHSRILLKSSTTSFLMMLVSCCQVGQVLN